MNTTPATTSKTLSPFAAQIVFKPNQLYQKKHEKWTFHSAMVSTQYDHAPQHLRNLERLVLQDFAGTYILASIFDNRTHTYQDSGQRRNNLILQISYNQIYIDRRAELDLSFLNPVFTLPFVQYMHDSFEEQNYKVMHPTPLQCAISQYKQTFNI